MPLNQTNGLVASQDHPPHTPALQNLAPPSIDPPPIVEHEKLHTPSSSAPSSDPSKASQDTKQPSGTNVINTSTSIPPQRQKSRVIVHLTRSNPEQNVISFAELVRAQQSTREDSAPSPSAAPPEPEEPCAVEGTADGQGGDNPGGASSDENGSDRDGEKAAEPSGDGATQPAGPRRRLVNEYDLDDDFIDDEEMMFVAESGVNAAPTVWKHGFFAWKGPVENVIEQFGEEPVEDSVAPSAARKKPKAGPGRKKKDAAVAATGSAGGSDASPAPPKEPRPKGRGKKAALKSGDGEDPAVGTEGNVAAQPGQPDAATPKKKRKKAVVAGETGGEDASTSADGAKPKKLKFGPSAPSETPHNANDSVFVNITVSSSTPERKRKAHEYPLNMDGVHPVARSTTYDHKDHNGAFDPLNSNFATPGPPIEHGGSVDPDRSGEHPTSIDQKDDPKKAPIKQKKPLALTPLPPSVQDAIDNLAKAAEKESFAEFRIFPEQLRPLLHQAARQADSELCLDENFIGHVTTVLPYNAFTMKRLIGRMLYPEQLAALQETSDRLCERLKEEVAIAVDMQMKSAPLDFTISMDAGENGGESKRKFKWNKELKLLLWNIVTTACQISDKEHDLAVVRKPSKDKTEVPRTSEMAVRRNVYAKLCSYWPPGWMSTLDISREWSQQKRKIDRQDKADKPPPKTGTEGQFEDPEVGKGEGTPDDGVGEGAKKRGKVKADKNGRGATTWTGAEIQANPTYTMVQEHAPFAHPTSEPVAMGGRLDEYDVSRAPMGQSYDPSTMSPSRSSSQPNHQHLPRSGFHDSAGVRMEWRPDLADHAPGMQYSGHFQQAPNGGRAEGSGTEVVVNRPQMQTPTGPIRPQFPTMVEESVDHRSPNRHIHPQQQYQQIYHPSVPPGLIRPDHHVMQQPRANNRNPHELGNVTEQHYNQPGPMVDTYFVQTHPGAVRPHPLHSPYHALPGNGQHGSPGPGQQQQSEVDPYARRPW